LWHSGHALVAVHACGNAPHDPDELVALVSGQQAKRPMPQTNDTHVRAGIAELYGALEEAVTSGSAAAMSRALSVIVV
jgi:hypothetical protein